MNIAANARRVIVGGRLPTNIVRDSSSFNSSFVFFFDGGLCDDVSTSFSDSATLSVVGCCVEGVEVLPSLSLSLIL